MKEENDKALALTPEEARELLYCFIHESQARYGKVNREAPLYLKLKKIAEPVLLNWDNYRDLYF